MTNAIHIEPIKPYCIQIDFTITYHDVVYDADGLDPELALRIARTLKNDTPVDFTFDYENTLRPSFRTLPGWTGPRITLLDESEPEDEATLVVIDDPAVCYAVAERLENLVFQYEMIE